jgi:hypothetical protein
MSKIQTRKVVLLGLAKVDEHYDSLKMVGMETYCAVFILVKGFNVTGIAIKTFHRFMHIPTS